MSSVVRRVTDIGEILYETLEKAPVERRGFVRRVCGDDEWLFHKVKQALSAEESQDSVLNPKIVCSVSEALLYGEAPGHRDCIGPYRILRLLGRGGMGSVYLAERSDGLFDHRVALKLLSSRDHNGELTRRFVQERQILASLHHPAIARLLDGGVTPDGSPYIVMEYIDGLPIDEYCDKYTLSINERLLLFDSVIDAVSYAHRNLVVHRDLKPSNILVTHDGHVKLLDFGIAKVLGTSFIINPAPQTQSIIRVMTPEYASPEQIAGQTITTASDVYQLGILLYELLCGCRLFRFDECTPSEVERLICSSVPQQPSKTIANNHEHQREIAAARGCSPRRLRRRLRGDLDTIVLMAIRKEPHRRFTSAGQLGRDLKRHLQGKVITARRSSIGFRTLRVLKRHSLLTISVVLLSVMVAFYTWRLAAERDRACSEAEKAREVSSFLKETLAVSDPGSALGTMISADDLLQRSIRRAQSGAIIDPGVQAEIMTTLGAICRKRGMYDEARVLLENALAYHIQNQSDEQVNSVLTRVALGDLATATGRYGEAEEQYLCALSSQEAHLGPEHPLLAETLDGLGKLKTVQARFPEAITYFERALDIRERSLDSWDPDLAASLSNVAHLCLVSMSCSYEKGEELFGRALRISQLGLGPDHPQVASILIRLAYLSRDQGRFEEAETLFRQAIGIRERCYGKEHPEVMAGISILAQHCQRLGRYQEAEELFERAITIADHTLEMEHPNRAIILDDWCRLKLAQGQLQEAESLCSEALRIRQASLRVDHPRLISSNLHFAQLRMEQGDLRGAESHLKQALKICERFSKLGTEITVYHDLGFLWIKAGRYEDALLAFKAAQISLDQQKTVMPELGYRLTRIDAGIHFGFGSIFDHLGARERAHFEWLQALERLNSLGYSVFVVATEDLRTQVHHCLGTTKLPMKPSSVPSGWHGNAPDSAEILFR
jgi:serine/threonine-protein kinase